MENDKDINWFKREIAPNLRGYELIYKFFENGDFGALNQVEFNSPTIGGNIDFWSSKWLGILVIDVEKVEYLLNVLLEPQQEQEKKEAFDQFLSLVMRG